MVNKREMCAGPSYFKQHTGKIATKVVISKWRKGYVHGLKKPI